MQMQPQGLSLDEARTLWERYRDACLIRPGLALAWVWTGGAARALVDNWRLAQCRPLCGMPRIPRA